MMVELLPRLFHAIALCGGLIYIVSKGGPEHARFARTGWALATLMLLLAYGRDIASGRFDGLMAGPGHLLNLWGELDPGERMALMWWAAATLCFAIALPLRRHLARKAEAAGAGAPAKPDPILYGRGLLISLAVAEAALFGLRASDAVGELPPKFHYALLTQAAAEQKEGEERPVLISGWPEGVMLNPAGSYFRQRDGRYYERLPAGKLGAQVEESLIRDPKTGKASRWLRVKNIEPGSCVPRVEAFLERFKPDFRSTEIRHRFTRLELIPADGAPKDPEAEGWAFGIKDAQRYCEHYLKAYGSVDMLLHF